MLTIDGQTYSHTDCDASNHYYKAIQVTVAETGYYRVDRNSSIGTYSIVYKNSFNPFRLSENVPLLNDDNCSQQQHQFKFVALLQTNTIYVWVVTTHSPNMTGASSIFVFGPNKVIFNHIGEYMHSFVNNQNKSIKYQENVIKINLF